VQCKGCSATLFEEHKEADEEEDHADEIDVNIAGRPFVDCVEVIEIGVVQAAVFRIRRPFDQVVNLTT
jgi:hypothetical protein